MNRTTRTLFLTFILFGGMLTSCNAKGNKTENTVTETPAPAAAETNWKSTPGLYAEIVTSKGTIVVSFEYQKAPVTVANFVGLAEGKIKNTAQADGKPYFDGLTFHRCIHTPHPFMIQGGDPKGNGSGGPGYSFGDEFDYSLNFTKEGVLAMANAGPNTNGSQFFITEAPVEQLNYGYSVFGHTVSGQALVAQINNGEVISKVNIVRVGKEAEAFDAAAVFAKKDELLAAKSASFKAQKAEADKVYTVTAEELVRTKYPNAKKTASGLYYIVETEGTGPQATAGKTVSVHYLGTFANGKKFDSSYDRNQPLQFVLGQGQVIKGWDEGIALMKVGSKVKLIIPYNLAYGDAGMPPAIPAKATLIFETELMDVK